VASGTPYRVNCNVVLDGTDTAVHAPSHHAFPVDPCGTSICGYPPLYFVVGMLCGALVVIVTTPFVVDHPEIVYDCNPNAEYPLDVVPTPLHGVLPLNQSVSTTQ